MRLAAVALGSLLFACTVNGDNADTNAENAAIPPPTSSTPEPSSPQQPPNGPTEPEPSGEAGLAASPERLSAGATVTLSLNNRSQERLGYNLCTSSLQTAGGEEVRTDRVCTMELRTLEPGGTATYSYDLPGTLDDGSYRFRTSVERMDSGTRSTVTSNTIEVR